MSLQRNRRLGPPGVARAFDALLAQTEAVMPREVVQARSRWANLQTGEPVHDSGVAAAIDAAVNDLYALTSVRPNAPLRATDGVLVDPVPFEQARLADERFGFAHDVWLQAVGRAVVEFVQVVGEHEPEVVRACQARHAVVGAEMYAAVEQLPPGYDGQGVVFAEPTIKDAWMTAARCWSEVEALRALADSYVDPDSYRHHQYTVRLAFCRTTAAEDLDGQSGFAFGLALCRRLRDSSELSLMTRAEASEVAEQLWPTVTAQMSGWSPSASVRLRA